jgi:thioredoxin-like negative regulator of GroEL
MLERHDSLLAVLEESVAASRNHDTFNLQRVNYEARPELAARLGVDSSPAIVVIDHRRVRAKLEPPRNCADLQAALARWVR